MQTSCAGSQTETEKKLVELWAEVLGIDRIGIHDNFFELGGNSILTIVLMSKINKLFINNVSVSTLFKCQTVKLLAEYLATNQKTEWTPLVPIHATGNLPPIYFISGIAMDVSTIQPLLKYLGADQPVYGLEYSGIDPQTKALASIEAIATLNIKALKKNQTGEPYILCGYSFGGMVAFEMAKQLINNGDSSAHVYFFDALSPDLTPVVTPEMGMRDLMNHIEDLFHIKLNIPSDELKSLDNKNIYRSIGTALAEKPESELKLPDYTEFSSRLETLKIQQSITYHPEKVPYPIPITLFRSESNEFKEQYLGWEKYSTNRIYLKIVPGDHQSMMKEPYAKFLGKEMKQELVKIIQKFRNLDGSTQPE